MRSKFYIPCVAIIVLVAVGSKASFFLFPPNVGLLGVANPNHIVLGATSVKQTNLEFYARYEYDIAVLGIAVHTTTGVPRYLPLYGSSYRGMPPIKIDAYLSKNHDGLWIEVLWAGRTAKPLAYFPLADDGTPQLAPQDTYHSPPIPPSIGSYDYPARDREPNATNVLSVQHNGE